MFNLSHMVATKIETRFALRAKGLRRSQINEALDMIDEDMLGLAVDTASAALKAPIDMPGVVATGAVGALGDGTIINAIIDWFKSPQGQAVIAALVSILLKALGVP